MSNSSDPRLHDRRTGDEHEVFHSKILPPYLRRAKAIEELIPWLYLKGISTGGFTEALASLLGENAAGLSATTITRLVGAWQNEHAEWSARSLADMQYVYVWADGIYFNVRLEDEANTRQCILVLMGATADGKKELIAVLDGYRESEQSWTELLNDVKRRGLTVDPKLTIALTVPLASGRRRGKCGPATREQTLLGAQDRQRAGKASEKPAKARRKRDCMASGRPRRAHRPNTHSTVSWKTSKRSTRRRSSA